MKRTYKEILAEKMKEEEVKTKDGSTVGGFIQIVVALAAIGFGLYVIFTI